MKKTSLFYKGINEKNIGNYDAAMEIFKTGYEKGDLCCSFEYFCALYLNEKNDEEKEKYKKELFLVFQSLSNKLKIGELTPDEKHIYSVFFFIENLVFKDDRLWRKFDYEALAEGSLAANEFILKNESYDINSLNLGGTIYSYQYNMVVDETEDLINKYEDLIERADPLIIDASKEWLKETETKIKRNCDVLSNFCFLLTTDCVYSNAVSDDKNVWDNVIPRRLKKAVNKKLFIQRKSTISPELYDLLEKNKDFYQISKDEYNDIKDQYLEIINKKGTSQKVSDALLKVLKDGLDGSFERVAAFKDINSKLLYDNSYRYGLLVHEGYPKEMLDNIVELIFNEDYKGIKDLSKFFKIYYKDFKKRENEIFVSNTNISITHGIINHYDIEDIELIIKNKLSQISSGYIEYVDDIVSKHNLNLKDFTNGNGTRWFYFENVNEPMIRCNYEGDMWDVDTIFERTGLTYIYKNSYGDGKLLACDVPAAWNDIINNFFSLVFIDAIKENKKYNLDLPYVMAHVGFTLIGNWLDVMTSFLTECVIAEDYIYYTYDFDDINKEYINLLKTLLDENIVSIYDTDSSNWLYKSNLFDDDKMSSQLLSTITAFLLYRKHRENPEKFSKMFDKFVKEFRSKSLEELLNIFGIDLKNKKTVLAAIDEMHRFIDNFENVVNKINK